MFATDVVSFGTVATSALGLDALIDTQWRQVWPRTAGFAFEPPLLLALGEDMAVVALEWHSQGKLASTSYARAGRATLLLRLVQGRLLCTHSHFSMTPGTVPLRLE